MNSRIAAIARYTLLEAFRTRLPALALLALGILYLAGVFVEQITISEGGRFQTAFYAAGARWAAVFIVAFYVLAAVAREFDDKVLDVVLALDLPRSHYLLGRLAGFVAICALLAGIASLPLSWSAPAQAVLQWGMSLAFELAIVAALALFCIITLNQLVPAAGFVMAFYVLARVLTAMRLIAGNPIGGADAPHQVIRILVEGLAYVIPAFDGWTRTAWLVDGRTSWADLVAIAAQGVIYLALLAGAAMFDLYRKNF
jgi:ABC-type transport system involved in multi-copper enzyme maturation permease subunit